MIELVLQILTLVMAIIAIVILSQKVRLIREYNRTLRISYRRPREMLIRVSVQSMVLEILFFFGCSLLMFGETLFKLCI
jgi:uncharacterized membrane protein